MSKLPGDQILQMETTCGSLLYELQIIWDEVGESDSDRDKMLLELEQECLEVYRRKVDLASRCRAQLRQAIADSEAELAAICSAMGERPVLLRKSDQGGGGSLKAELNAIVPQLEEMRKRKSDRRSQFLEVLDHIQKLSEEIAPVNYNPSMMVVDDSDLSLRRLEELQKQLQALQKEKADRLNKVLGQLSSLNSLCQVLSMDFKCTVEEVHPSLGESDGSKNISNDTIERLGIVIERLREIKMQRMQKLQDLATAMVEMWNLMDTPMEEQQMFQSVTRHIAASEDEITEAGTLSIDFLNYVEAEVSRLEELKEGKMKELVLKKKAELQELRRRTHMVVETDGAMEYAIEAIESGAVDPGCILEQIEDQISSVKEEAFSRKEILEKVEKWLAGCEEESWLEEYNRDENRYNAGRGAHLTLKRAEKARATVNKLPVIVDALVSRTTAWERERGSEFKYDGIRLLSMLEEYTILRQEKEQERRRQRDQKKLQGQLIAEHEVLYGSKPSPSKTPSAKKVPRMSTGGANRRLSLGGTMLQPLPKFDSSHSTRSNHVSQPGKKLDEGSALSAGTRGLDVAPLSKKKHSFIAPSARETDAPVLRRPFTPVTPAHSETIGRGLIEDPNRPNIGSPLKTPSKLSSLISNEESKTPKMMQIPAPKTPMTVSVPMQTTEIAPSPIVSSHFGNTAVREITEDEIEYSFEERRAGFILPRINFKAVHV